MSICIEPIICLPSLALNNKQRQRRWRVEGHIALLIAAWRIHGPSVAPSAAHASDNLFSNPQVVPSSPVRPVHRVAVASVRSVHHTKGFSGRSQFHHVPLITIPDGVPSTGVSIFTNQNQLRGRPFHGAKRVLETSKVRRWW